MLPLKPLNQWKTDSVLKCKNIFNFLFYFISVNQSIPGQIIPSYKLGEDMVQLSNITER